ncbi:MAG TPA: DNA polymerase/3'-5' exonuclease PolX [Thermomicrobiales bacterium]|jgi:DNA polymerase (family 10)|nr:DNA polymerase/3'-5' exonuclease PolX [Thermomicrobiales bacterium]
MTNAEIARELQLLGDLLEIQGESSFKVGAYRRARETIEGLPEPLAKIRERDGLEKIPGVGKAISSKIEELLDTGTMKALIAAEVKTPRGVADLLAVPGIGPKKAARLHAEIGIAGLNDLRVALDDGRADAVLGAGERKRIAQGLGTLVDGGKGRMPLGQALVIVEDLIAQLRERVPDLETIEAAGSVRRVRETVGDLDIVAAWDEPEAIVDAFTRLPAVERVESRGPTRCRVALVSGIAADLWVLPPRHWGALLFHVTGDKYHDIRIRDMAIAKGGRLSEYGYTEGDDLTTFADEDDVYQFFGLQPIPPPMRAGGEDVDLALKGRLPEVVALANLRGDLHCHTTWSDGKATVREMALAARDRGYQWLAITDHSKGLAVANGLDGRRLREQQAEIVAVNEELAPFHVLQGIECEVRSDGRLDLDDDVLAELDLVIAAVHSSLGQPRDRLTERAIKAINHPLVDILAHPTGRIVGGRAGGDFDMDAIYAAAAAAGTVLEIDADPARMDLRDTHARAAIAAGCMLSIDSDAHSIAGFDNLGIGVGVAQRGWVPPDRVLNTLTLKQLQARLKRNRKR